MGRGFWCRWTLAITLRFNLAFFVAMWIAIMFSANSDTWFQVILSSAFAGATGSFFLGAARTVLQGRIAQANDWI